MHNEQYFTSSEVKRIIITTVVLSFFIFISMGYLLGKHSINFSLSNWWNDLHILSSDDDFLKPPPEPKKFMDIFKSFMGWLSLILFVLYSYLLITDKCEILQEFLFKILVGMLLCAFVVVIFEGLFKLIDYVFSLLIAPIT